MNNVISADLSGFGSRNQLIKHTMIVFLLDLYANAQLKILSAIPVINSWWVSNDFHESGIPSSP